jgi:hypothetical protein
MPIKPELKRFYSRASGWFDLREKILRRAKNRCEFCHVMNESVGWRHPVTGLFMDSMLWRDRPAGVREFRICLTVAHLDHNPENRSSDNLRALCQRCHLNHDRKRNAYLRKQKRIESEKLPLFEGLKQ